MDRATLTRLLRRHALFLAVFLPLALIWVSLGAFDGLGSIQGDGLIYMVTARHYAPYWPAEAVGAIYAETTQFPPIYPLLLAATGGAADFFVAHGVTAITLLAACVAFYCWLLKLGLGAARAALGVALLALLPGSFYQLFFLHPEGLYVALGFVALTSLASAEERARSGSFWIAAVAIAIALVTRTVGITLLPALMICLARARPAGWPWMLVVAVTPAVGWALIHDPPFSYSDSLAETYGQASFESMARTVTTAIAAAVQGLADNVTEARGLLPVLAGLGLIAAAVALARFVRGKPDAWYLAAYLGVMAVWPYPQEAERLTWVVVPILLAYLLLAGAWAAERWAALAAKLRVLIALAPAAALALIIVPSSLLLASRAMHSLTRDQPALRHFPDWYRHELALSHWLANVHLGITEGLRSFENSIPADECVFATMPLLTTFHTGRGAMVPPFESVDDAEFEQRVSESQCRYFIGTRVPGRGFSTPFYPLERLGDRAEILAEYSIDTGPPDQRRVVTLARITSP